MGRDFSGQNLRGRNFRGQDLRGAIFVNADIRGANFTDAELQGADFTGAIAGLQKRWAIGQSVLAFGLSLASNFVAIIFNVVITRYLFQEDTIKEISIVPGIFIILYLLGILLVLAKEGFTTRSFSIVSVLTVITFAGAVVGAFVGAGSGVGSVAFAGAGVDAFVFVFAVAIAGAGAGAGAFGVAGAGAGASLILGLYVNWRAGKGDEKFALIRSFRLVFGSLGGTSFKGANLTAANFAQAKLKSATFANSRNCQTTLTRTNWKDSKKLDQARPGNSLFSNFKVLQLLTTGQGINQDFSQFNLRGANLDSAQLNGANLKNADLTQASLRQADLQNANLTELQAVGTNFTKAYLTGACLEAWNIDQANLSDIDCAFYFLRETPDAKGNRDRRPHDPDRTYELGDAEKMLTEARNVVEVLLKQCTNAKDLAQSLQRLTETYPESILQKLERKDNSDFLVTLTVPPDTDKANVETLLHTAYDEIRALRGEVKDLHTLRAVDLKDALLAIAHHPKPFIQTIQQTTGDHTVTTQENQNISAGSGSFINTGTLNATNSTLGIISGNATTSIGQLPTPIANEPDLKTALTDLQTAIESSSLSDDDKAEALEQVKSIAEAGNTPKDNAIQKGVKTAMKMLKGTIADLPATEDLVKVMIKIAPIVAAFFGMPAM